jgi:hypothetical protein
MSRHHFSMVKSRQADLLRPCNLTVGYSGIISIVYFFRSLQRRQFYEQRHTLFSLTRHIPCGIILRNSQRELCCTLSANHPFQLPVRPWPLKVKETRYALSVGSEQFAVDTISIGSSLQSDYALSYVRIQITNRCPHTRLTTFFHVFVSFRQLGHSRSPPNCDI